MFGSKRIDLGKVPDQKFDSKTQLNWRGSTLNQIRMLTLNLDWDALKLLCMCRKKNPLLQMDKEILPNVAQKRIEKDPTEEPQFIVLLKRLNCADSSHSEVRFKVKLKWSQLLMKSGCFSPFYIYIQCVDGKGIYAENTAAILLWFIDGNTSPLRESNHLLTKTPISLYLHLSTCCYLFFFLQAGSNPWTKSERQASSSQIKKEW